MKDKLTRSRTNRIFGGVSAGLAEYFDIDPIIVRILFVISIFFSGVGILLYLILWIVIPEAPFIQSYNENNEFDFPEENIDNPIINEEKSKQRKIMFGIILLVTGSFFLLTKFFSFIDFEDLFPIVLIGVGVYIIFKSKKGK
jgi:phage shock protein PspC (stress-responsive transcriptional regulator)